MSKFVDPYIDPETGVLRNLAGARTYDELLNVEGEFVAMRTNEFLEQHSAFRPSGTLEDLCLIHRSLFQDVYDWAGEIRTVEIRKETEGAEFFLPSTNIAMGIEWSRSELLKDGMMKQVDREHFAERLAYHYDNYNFVHPFREGNGRTQRLFWTYICHDAGYDLDWRLVSGEENDEASRLAAEQQDYSLLTVMFSRILSPVASTDPINRSMVGSSHLD